MKMKFLHTNRRIAATLLALLIGVFTFTLPAYASEAETAEPAVQTEQTETTETTETAGAAETAEETEADAGITVTIRVESCVPDGEETILTLTETTTNAEGVTVLDVLDAVTDSDYTADISEYGAFITSIGGLGDETGQFSWMFAVNNELAADSADAHLVENGDDIVFYFIDWQVADYAYFDVSALPVTAGEAFTLTLMGYDFTDGAYPVEGAEVYINATDPEERLEDTYITDAEGQVEIILDTPNVYAVSALLYNEDGIPAISRPLCVAAVMTAEEAAALEAADTTAEVVEATDETADADAVEAADEAADADTVETTDETADTNAADAVETTDETADADAVETTDEATGTDAVDTTVVTDVTYTADTTANDSAGVIELTPNSGVAYHAAAGEIIWMGQSITLAEALRPVDENGVWYLPVRAIAEALGAAVSWDAETSLAAVAYDSREFTFFTNGLDSATPVKLIGDYAFVPLDFLAEKLGAPAE